MYNLDWLKWWSLTPVIKISLHLDYSMIKENDGTKYLAIKLNDDITGGQGWGDAFDNKTSFEKYIFYFISTSHISNDQ